MIGNFIKYKDRNDNACKGKVIDKILVHDEKGVLRTAYLCSNTLRIAIAFPEQITSVL